MRVAMQKVDGVQSVKVSLNDGLTILDLKPDNAVTLAKLRQVIKNNGFVSKEAQIVARGSIAYSAVTQPRPCPRSHGGGLSSSEAAQRTCVSPKRTRHDPSA